MASSMLYGAVLKQRKTRYWLVPAPGLTSSYPPLPEVPITARLLADLGEIPQTLTDTEKSKLVADLEWRREQGWGVYCGFIGAVGKPETKHVSAPSTEPRFAIPTNAMIRVWVTIPEFVDTKNPSKSSPEHRYPGKFRISSMGLEEFDPWNPDHQLDQA
jgi:hypothetical protein